MSGEFVDDFDTIVGDVTDLGQFQTFLGASVTHIKTFNETLTWMNTVSMFPRIYQLKNRQMSGEPSYPGSFVSVVMGTIADMPFRMTFGQGLWFPEVSLSVPMGNMSFEMTGSISDTFVPALKADFGRRGKYFTVTSALSTQGSQGMGEIAVGTKLGPLKLGCYLSSRMVDQVTILRIVSNYTTKKGTDFGIYTGLSSEGISNVLRVQKKVNGTRFGAALHLIPKVLGSELFIGLEREFSMSSLSAAISSSGSVKSCYVRHLDKSMRLTFTADSNVFRETHAFGIAVTLKP